MSRILSIIAAVIILIVISVFIISVFNIRLPFLTETKKVVVKDHTFSAEVVKTQKAQEKGLSGRSSLADDRAMLFVFETPDYQAFWMKDMKIPLDILFIRDTTIVTIHRNVQPPKNTTDPLPIYKPTKPADKVLEIKAGLSDQYGIQEGDTIQADL